MARFYAKVAAGINGCHIWTADTHNKGYGGFYVRGVDGKERMVRAHVWVYEQQVGPVPAEKELDHTCDTRACVNVRHLHPVPHIENVRRGAVAKLDLPTADLIRARYAAGGVTQRQLADQYGVDHSLVSQIVRGRIWRTGQVA